MSVRARSGLLALAVVALVTVAMFVPRDIAPANVLGDSPGTREVVSNSLIAAPLDAAGLPEMARSKGKRAGDLAGPLLGFALVVLLTLFVATSYRRTAVPRSSVRMRASARFATSRRAPPRFV
jgi:hypothetical protein